VKLPAPKGGTVSAATRKSMAHDTAVGGQGAKPVSRRRSRAITAALRREGHTAASKSALARQAKSAARKRTAGARSAAARRAANTKGRGRSSSPPVKPRT